MPGPARHVARSVLLIAAVTSLVAVSTLSAQPTDVRGRVRSWITANQSAVVRELLDLLALPNVAADRPNIRKNAEHLRGMLSRRGFAAELRETAGNPLVLFRTIEVIAALLAG